MPRGFLAVTDGWFRRHSLSSRRRIRTLLVYLPSDTQVGLPGDLPPIFGVMRRRPIPIRRRAPGRRVRRRKSNRGRRLESGAHHRGADSAISPLGFAVDLPDDDRRYSFPWKHSVPAFCICSLCYSASAPGRVTRAAAAQAAGLGTGISYRGERNLSLRRRIKPGYARGVVIGDLAGSPPCLWGVIVSLVSILCLSATHLRAPRPVYGA